MRARLTVLYAVPFLLTGALLLTFPLLQTKVTAPVGSPRGAAHPVVSGPDFGQQLLAGTAIAVVLMGVVAFLLGWIVAGRFLRPLRTIVTTAREISATNLHRRLDVGGRRTEFTRLAATLNDLFARLEAAFGSQRNFVANASHELRTPLTAERTLLQVALADPDASVESLRATCQEVLALGEQEERLIEALLTLATSEQGVEQREVFDLASVAAEVVQGRTAPGISVTTALEPAPISGDVRLVESLVANLVENALRHNVPGGSVQVTTASPGLLRVENTGFEIASSQVERLFEPFRQLGTDRVRRVGGYGLGLAIVRAIAQAHGATLVARARPEGGLTIEVAFR
jgi:signal transduction histidine kinase